VILRPATVEDQLALESFDVGDTTAPWLGEVSEIVAGLIGWRQDPGHGHLERQVVVAESDGGIVAVLAHERIELQGVGALPDHRYLMVVAVRTDHQRTGVARVITESVLKQLQREGVRTVRWLVHPRNVASIAFSRRVFPEADETQPPEDRPYVTSCSGCSSGAR